MNQKDIKQGSIHKDSVKQKDSTIKKLFPLLQTSLQYAS